MVVPNVSAMFKLFDVVDVAPQIAYRQRYYWALTDDYDSTEQGLPEFTTRTSTRLQKVYSQPFGMAGKIRHTLEPELTYRYIPDVKQTDLPDFDSYDRIAQLNQVEYALVQRLTLRYDHPEGESTYRDLLYLRVSQPYDFSTTAPENRFLDLRIEVKLLPVSWAALETDTRLDVDTGKWDDISITGRIWDKQENSLKVEYHRDADADIDYGTVNLSVAFLKPFYLNYQQRYEFATNELLEQVVGVEYRRQCWSALLSLREHDDERSVMLTFTMRGIGAIGGVNGNLGGI